MIYQPTKLQQTTIVVAVVFLAAGRQGAAQLYDVNDDNAGSGTQAGWKAVDASGMNGVTFIAVGTDAVELDPVVIDDRRRPGHYGGAEADMWLDFIFANGSNSEGSGMDVTVGGFAPNTVYNVRLWAFDTSSGDARSATWNRTVFTFNGDDPEPMTLLEYTVTVSAVSNAAGTVLLEGRTNLADSENDQHNVFLNGFEVLDTIDTLSLEVNTSTGATKIKNAHNTSFDLNYYEILSPDGSLDRNGWSPLDTDPGGVSTNGWQASDGGAPSILAESNLLGMATVANSGSTDIDLGHAFGGGTQDLKFWYAAPDGDLIPGPVVYVTGGFLADFDNDGDVDASDLSGAGGWVERFGDDLNGKNFLDWQREYPSGGEIGAVPEPSAIALLAFACLSVATSARRRK